MGRSFGTNTSLKSSQSFRKDLSASGIVSSASFKYHPLAKVAPRPLLILLSRTKVLVLLSVKTPPFIMKYAFMASSHLVASLFLPEKSSESPALISWICVAILLSGGRGADSKTSPSSLVISMSELGIGTDSCSGIEVMVKGRGSSAAGDRHHVRMSVFLQALCILHLLLSPDGLIVPS